MCKLFVVGEGGALPWKGLQVVRIWVVRAPKMRRAWFTVTPNLVWGQTWILQKVCYFNIRLLFQHTSTNHDVDEDDNDDEGDNGDADYCYY